MAEILIRDAHAGDVDTILDFVKALALFERQPAAVVATAADLLRDGFGTAPRFHCAIAEIDGNPVGFTLWFQNYSTWKGRPGIFLEDIYVSDAARGQGVGAKLLTDLARRAVAIGAGRLDLNVLDWNPARGFYERLGIQQITEWLPYRIEGDALAALAGR